jgi:hypothetical protein
VGRVAIAEERLALKWHRLLVRFGMDDEAWFFCSYGDDQCWFPPDPAIAKHLLHLGRAEQSRGILLDGVCRPLERTTIHPHGEISRKEKCKWNLS